MKRRDLLKAGALGLMGCATVPAITTREIASTPHVVETPPAPIMDEDGKLFRTALDQLDVSCVLEVIRLHMYETSGFSSDRLKRWSQKYPWMVEELKARIKDGPEAQMRKLSHKDTELMNQGKCRAKLWYTLYFGKGEEV